MFYKYLEVIWVDGQGNSLKKRLVAYYPHQIIFQGFVKYLSFHVKRNLNARLNVTLLGVFD